MFAGTAQVLVFSCAVACSSSPDDSDPRNRLPEGFVALEGTPLDSSGWPSEIRCIKDGAVMVFVPGGEFLSGAEQAQIERLAKLTLELDRPWKTAADQEEDFKAFLLHGLDKDVALGVRPLSPDEVSWLKREARPAQIVALDLVASLRAAGGEIPEDEVHRWREQNLAGTALLNIEAIGNVLQEQFGTKELDEIRTSLSNLERISREAQLGPVKMAAGELAERLQPAQRARVATFYIDKYEVTNAQYRKFIDEVNDSRHLPQVITRGYGYNIKEDKPVRVYDLWSDKRRNRDLQPVTCVSEADAEAYARWTGKSLPTRTQWERAAGGDGERLFPWGDHYSPGMCHCNVVDHTKANVPEQTKRRGWLRETIALIRDIRDIGRRSELRVPVEVGSYPHDVSPLGVFDMAGNVTEWLRVDADKHIQLGGSADSFGLDDLSPKRQEIPDVYSPTLVGFRTVLNLDRNPER